MHNYTIYNLTYNGLVLGVRIKEIATNKSYDIGMSFVTRHHIEIQTNGEIPLQKTRGKFITPNEENVTDIDEDNISILDTLGISYR
jgi:HKD family nuclease